MNLGAEMWKELEGEEKAGMWWMLCSYMKIYALPHTKNLREAWMEFWS